MRLPTLLHNRRWRLAALAMLYSAQGLPFGLFNVAIPSWMATQTFTTVEIASFMGIVTLPWSLKLLAAPLMDRFTYLPMGYRRPWVIGAQMGVLLSFAAFAVIPDELLWLTIIGCLTNTFAATQDVAVDGLAIDILAESDRATANGFMFGGQYIGISIGASGGGYALLYLGLPGVGALASLLMLAVVLVPVSLLERPGERRFPWSPGAATPRTEITESTWQLLKATASVLLMPVSVLLLLSQFGGRAASGMILAHLPAYSVQSLGLANTTYNDISTAGGIASAIIGVLISPWFDRLGAHNAHWLTLGLFIGSVLLMPLTLDPFPTATIVVQWLAAHLLGITLIATMMRFCHPAVAATQFAIYMAMANLSYSMGPLLYARVSGWLGHTEVLLLAAGLAATALPLWFVLVTRHTGATTL